MIKKWVVTHPYFSKWPKFLVELNPFDQKVSFMTHMMLRSTCKGLKCAIVNARFFKGKKSGDGTKCNKKGHLSLSLSLLKIQNNLQNTEIANDCQLGYLACNRLWCGGR
jgi:hypothetical protein